jgi:hypothetical protein
LTSDDISACAGPAITSRSASKINNPNFFMKHPLKIFLSLRGSGEVHKLQYEQKL